MFSGVGPWLVYGNTEGDEVIDCRFAHWVVMFRVGSAIFVREDMWLL